MTGALLLDMYFTAGELSRLRRCLADVVRMAGLAEPRRSDFVLAVHEVTGNAVQHGGGRGRARLWYVDGALRCRLTDDGPGLTDEAIPAALPDPDADFGEDGRGLWLARELSDRLHITGGPGGAIVTLEFELVVTARRDTPGLASAGPPGRGPAAHSRPQHKCLAEGLTRSQGPWCRRTIVPDCSFCG